MPDPLLRTQPHAAHAGADFPFQALVEQSLAGIYVLQDECFQYANRTWAALAGYLPEEMVGRHLRDFVPPDFLPEVLRLYHLRLAADPPSIRFITRGLHRAGHTVLIEVHGTRMLYRGRPAVVGIGVDVTERVHNEQALRDSQARLQALAAYGQDRLEQQRAQYASALHDELGGMLSSVKLDVARLQRRADRPALRQISEDLRRLTQDCIATVRRLAHDLRPSSLDHLGLSAALRQSLTAFAERGELCLHLDLQLDDALVSPRRATAAYRIVQEALTNVGRHAQAGQVRLQLWAEAGQLRLVLEDDGCGFDPVAVAAQQPLAMGLASMHERARELGGALHLSSAPGAGTRLSLRLPLL
ncbi:PAS domain-containing sensor histidine kinase [Pseudaquabacterium pictum]|uniref:Oxygen sensor histidine kinase NreB n=1 Tax=Pseudaquabacterium pictum TaxID=2315236 RepID=A0A480AUB6_9BURK|nr:PAS domain-containing sensor histidine kinase [Rubrivivax pictus]GCL65001.1 two-component system sensor kinase [Rubrivivax pictus]